MKNSVVSIIIFFVFCLKVNAQVPDSVKIKVDAFPEKLSSVGELAGIINNSFKRDSDKAAAVYYWMATNLEYDVRKHFSNSKNYTYNFRYKSHDAKVKKMHNANWGMYSHAIRRRKTTYFGYVLLYKQLCNNVGLDCAIVSGTFKNSLKSIGKKSGRRNHMWNAVKIGNKWQLVDVVCGSGILNETDQTYTKYYSDVFLFIDPNLFFLNHFPRNTVWLMCNEGKDDFVKLPFYHGFYFSSGIKIENPLTGVISKAEAEDSIVNIEVNIPSDLLSNYRNLFSYSIESIGKINAVDLKERNGKLFLEIPLSESRKIDYLNVYLDKKPIVSYKIH